MAKYPWKTTPVGGSFFVPNAVSGFTYQSSDAVTEAYQSGFIKFNTHLGTRAVPKTRWKATNEFSKKGKVLGVTVERAA